MPKQNSIKESLKKVKKTVEKKKVKAKKTKKKSPVAWQPIMPAVPLHDVKQASFNIPNLFVNDHADEVQKRILIFTPTTGLVRVEWMQARYGQIIPTNWSFVDMQQHLSPWLSVGYQLADAQNLMAREVVEGDYEWVIYVEHDNLLPPDGFLKFNQYINEHNTPVVSGLYFLKSDITEPLIYRGRGTSHFKDWKLGDKVWVDGIPFGFRLENAGLIKAAWETSEEYTVNGIKTRRVFSQPNSIWFDNESGGVVTKGGTTDLEWCTRIMKEKLLEKAGFPEHQKMKNPFLVDTSIFVRHIDQSGRQWPIAVPSRFIPPKGYKGKEIR